MIKRTLFLATGLMVAGASAHAERKLTVKVTHPPALGSALAGSAIAQGQFTGDCAKEFGDLLFQDLRAHSLPMSAPGDGLPVIAISGAVERCEGRPQPAILGEGLPAVHIARTEGWFAAQVRAVDAGGREVASATIRGHAQQENQSQTSTPEWPAAAGLKALALRQAIADARRLYTDWTENREIPFMDNKDCGLKEEFEAAKSGDYAKLLLIARPNADSCNGKVAMEAWYDLGIALWLTRHFDQAATAFQKCVDLKGSKLAAGFLEESRKEAAAANARQPKPAPAAPQPPTQTGIVMTNDFIIKLAAGNVDEAEILKMIANQPARFTFEPTDLERLKAAGVSDAVIAAMRAKLCCAEQRKPR